MKILIDTREQKPLSFLEETSVEVLPYGDYCAKFCPGVRSSTFFERKSMGDLYGTLSKGYGRFKVEMAKAKAKKDRLVIIVEGTLLQVLQGYRHSKRDPGTVLKQLFTIRVRHGVETVFCSSRPEMARYIVHFYQAEYSEFLYRTGQRKDF